MSAFLSYLAPAPQSPLTVRYAVFVLNYSWAHAGLWTLAKRLLPSTALQKIFFPSDVELQRMLTAESLPEGARCYLCIVKLADIGLKNGEVDFHPSIV